MNLSQNDEHLFTLHKKKGKKGVEIFSINPCFALDLKAANML